MKNKEILDAFRKDYPLLAFCVLSASQGLTPLDDDCLNMGPEYWEDKARNFITRYRVRE